MSSSDFPVLVRAIRYEATDIWSFELGEPVGANLPPFAPGAHINVHLPGGLVRQYSLCGEIDDLSRYVIAVLRAAGGRGGSKVIHERIRPGDRLQISAPRNNFPLVQGASRYVLVAGGIGITPIVSMVERLVADGALFELHYCARTPEKTAFRERLIKVAGERVRFIYDGGRPEDGLDAAALLKQPIPNTHVYCCGPSGLMAAVRKATQHWAADAVHFEYFEPVPEAASNGKLEASDVDFEIELARTQKRFIVPAGNSIVDILRDNGIEVDTSCEAGVCGTCRTRYLSGVPIHNDYVLDDDERREQIMICCGRARGLLVLDL